MKKIFPLFLLLSLMLSAFFLWLPKNAWLDSFLSNGFGDRFEGARLSFKGSRLVNFQKIQFEALELQDDEAQTLVRAGHGEIYFNRLFWLIRKAEVIDLYLGEVALTDALKKKIPFAFSLPESFAKEPLSFDRLHMVLVSKNGRATLHVVELSSTRGVVLRGGFRTKDERLVSAHFIVAFSNTLLDRVPRQIISRMISRGNNREFRLRFRENLLTVVGASGPLFEAQWKS